MLRVVVVQFVPQLLELILFERKNVSVPEHNIRDQTEVLLTEEQRKGKAGARPSIRNGRGFSGRHEGTKTIPRPDARLLSRLCAFAPLRWTCSR